MSMRAVDVHGFGGGFTLGVVQAGWELAGKMSREVGFGVYNTLANRRHLGQQWDSYASSPELWPIENDVQMVFGNPPCSGFSTLSNAKFRGADASINDYMWELIGYAGRVAPEIVVWESVQTTFRQGMGLMRQLRQKLEEDSGHTYHLTHVLHNNLSHGGMSMRKRYFFVASRVPFGAGFGRVSRQGGQLLPLDLVPTLNEGLGDLAPLGTTMSPQPYRGVQLVGDETFRSVIGSQWARREVLSPEGWVDGHDVVHSPGNDRVLSLFDREDTHWESGENLATLLRRHWQEHGEFPRGWDYQTKTIDPSTGQVTVSTKAEKLVKTNFHLGFSQPVRWYGDRPANVITGGAAGGIIHPTRDRFLTHRELARIQGFPDDWEIWKVRTAPDVGPAWGKGVPVQAGRWIAHWAKESLEGRPGELTGVPLEQYHRKDLFKQWGGADNETVVDTTYAFRQIVANPTPVR